MSEKPGVVYTLVVLILFCGCVPADAGIQEQRALHSQAQATLSALEAREQALLAELHRRQNTLDDAKDAHREELAEAEAQSWQTPLNEARLAALVLGVVLFLTVLGYAFWYFFVEQRVIVWEQHARTYHNNSLRLEQTTRMLRDQAYRNRLRYGSVEPPPEDLPR